MSTQHFTQARNIARLAKQLGVTLPKDIAGALTHLEDISRSATPHPQAGLAARAIAKHLGNPAAFEKARKDAALTHATADAAAKIDGFLIDAAGSQLFLLMRSRNEEITRIIGKGLSGALNTLQETAGQLPAWFRPEHAADLSPELFKLWTQSRDAFALIESTANTVAPFYASSTAGHERHFTHLSATTLRYAKPGKIRTSAEGFTARNALAGRVERTQGVAGQGSTFVDGIFIPTALAHAGFSFEWATPSQVTERADALVAALTPATALA